MWYLTFLSVLVSLCIGYCADTNWEAVWDNRSPLYSISFSDSLNGCAVGGHGKSGYCVVKTNDGGRTWQNLVSEFAGTYSAIPIHEGFELYDVAAINDTTLWVTGGASKVPLGFIYSSSNGGKTWVDRMTEKDGVNYRIAFASPESGWATGWYGQLFHLPPVAKEQGEKVGNSLGINDIMFVDKDCGWAVGDHIYMTVNGGSSWKEQRGGNSWRGVSFVDAQTGWVAGGKGQILHTMDGGQHWTEQKASTKKDIYDIAFIDGQHGWAVGEGFILRTNDGGNSWVNETGLSNSTFWRIAFAGNIAVIVVSTDGKITRFRL